MKQSDNGSKSKLRPHFSHGNGERGGRIANLGKQDQGVGRRRRRRRRRRQEITAILIVLEVDEDVRDFNFTFNCILTFLGL
jgi:hypothetical protein